MREKIMDKIKSKIALVFIALIMLTQQYWLFGLLFLAWVIIDLKDKQTYLMEIIERRSNPILYWIIVAMWLSFAIMSLIVVG